MNIVLVNDVDLHIFKYNTSFYNCIDENNYKEARSTSIFIIVNILFRRINVVQVKRDLDQY